MLAERTFWEKATAMHVFCRQERRRGQRQSRHWHDLVRLDDADIGHLRWPTERSRIRLHATKRARLDPYSPAAWALWKVSAPPRRPSGPRVMATGLANGLMPSVL